jgi:hypothetical protein
MICSAFAISVFDSAPSLSASTIGRYCTTGLKRGSLRNSAGRQLAVDVVIERAERDVLLQLLEPLVVALRSRLALEAEAREREQHLSEVCSPNVTCLCGSGFATFEVELSYT